MHLVVDGYDGDSALQWDIDYVYNFLDTYPTTIGMTKITRPHVYKYQEGEPKDWGVSGFVLIAESHISIHTFPERRYTNIDVFSCKEFDPTIALDELALIFHFSKIKHWVLNRGLEHLESTSEAQNAVSSSRTRLRAEF